MGSPPRRAVGTERQPCQCVHQRAEVVRGPWGVWSLWGIRRLIPAHPARGWIAVGVVLGAPGMVWVKAGLVLAAPSLLSARAAAGKYMILRKWHLCPSRRNSSAAGEVMGQRCGQGSVLLA